MLVSLMGISSGVTKKDSKPFKILHYAYSDGRSQGQAVDKCFVYDDSGIDIPAGVSIGEALDLQFNQKGFLAGIYTPKSR